MSRAVSGRRSAIRKATSESCRISLSVSWLTFGRAYRNLRSGFAALEVLMARAVVAVRERGALARLALSRGRPAACNTSVERSGLDLLLDEADRRVDSLRHGPRHLGLHRDREVPANVLE